VAGIPSERLQAAFYAPQTAIPARFNQAKEMNPFVLALHDAQGEPAIGFCVQPIETRPGTTFL